MIDRNKLNNDITVFEYAALSLDVYRSPDRPPLPSGWKIIEDYQGYDGYFASLYEKNNNFVIAHRGTDFSKIGDVIADIEIFMGKIPEKIDKAYEFTEKMSKNRIINHTGHSLGAAIAQLINWNKKPFIPLIGRCITFESPGTKILLIDILKKLKCTDSEISRIFGMISLTYNTYLSNINIINCCNEHLGRVERFYNPSYEYDIPPDKFLPNFAFNLYFWLDYTKDQHSIENIYNLIKESYGSTIVTNNPIGSQKCYISYLDRKIRKEYWDGYVDAIWINKKEIRDEYKTISCFSKYFFEYVDDVYCKAKAIYADDNECLFKNSHVFFKSKKEKHEEDFEIIERDEEMYEMKNGKNYCSMQ